MNGLHRTGRRRRRTADGRHRVQVDFYRLESRRLLTTLSSPPVAEFPLRQSGGTPEGVAADPSGNGWVLLAPDSIAEISSGGSVLAEYRVPAYNGLAAATAQSELGLIAYNSVDGNLWFYEATSNVFGKLDPSTGAITEYPLLPFASNPVIYQIVAGPEGNIYFTEPSLNEIAVFDINTDLISQFTMPLADTQPQGIVLGGDGNLWFTEGGQNKIGSLNPNTHVITNYAFEPPSYPTNTQAEGITTGPNNTIWFVERQNNVVQEFDINSGKFTTSVPPYWPPPPAPQPPPGPANLWSIAEGADGNIYYTEPAYGWVGVYYTSSGVSNRIYYPPTASPSSTASEANLNGALIASGPDGSDLLVAAPPAGVLYDMNLPSSTFQYPTAQLPPVLVTNDSNDVISVGNDLWFTDPLDGIGQIGRFDPTTQTNTQFPLPPMTSPPQNQYPNQLTEDSNGDIWFTETSLNLIGKIDPATGAISQTFLTSTSHSPVGIVWDPAPQEEQFWMTEPSYNQIVSFNPATSGSAVAPISFPDPVDILVDPAKGYLWISEGAADKIIQYDPVHEQILYTFSTKSSPNQLIWGPDGNIWFTESSYVGILVPPTGPGTGSIKTEIPVSGGGNDLFVGPSSGTYASTIWFTQPGSSMIGEINTSTESLVGYVKAARTNAVAITLGPDGNEWFTSGQGTPTWMGAVVLNPNDLGTQVVVTTGPPSVGVESTVFGGFIYGFGLVVSVENSAGQIDPFVQQGSITIAIDKNPGGGTLGGAVTIDLSTVPLPVADGMAVFDGLTIDSPGQGYTLQATYSLGLNAPVTSPFTVTGPATQLIVTAQPPSSVGAGVPFGLTIAAEDSNGFVVPSFDDAVSLSIVTNPTNGVLNGTNPRGALYGTAAFNDLSIDQVGKGYQLQATDVSNLPPGDVPPTTITTKPFDIVAGPAAQLLFSTRGEPPTTATAGQNFAAANPIIVNADDAFGNLNTTYNGAVTIVLANNATGTIVGTLKVNAVKGVATFSDIEIDTAGTFQLEATAASLTQGTSTSITISPAAPAKLVWTAEPPSAATAGFPLGASIIVEDTYNNLETGFSQDVSIALDLNGKSDTTDLAGKDTVGATNGSAAFSDLIINADGGPFTLIATSAGLTSPASSAITVVEPTLVVTSQPTGDVTAGNGFSITVQANTNTGAVDMAFTDTVDLSIDSGPAGSTIQGTISATADAGVANFDNVLLDKAGTYVLQATSSKLMPGTTTNITVVAQTNVAALYIVQEPPASVQAGAGFGLVVGGEDQFGNTTALTGQVSVAIKNNPGAATLSGTTNVTASSGVATFSGLSLNVIGIGYTLTASAGSVTPVTTSGINVTATTAAKLVIPSNGEPPGSASAGQAFSMVVDAEDQYGNIDPTFQGSVTIAQPGNITGTTTVAARNGVATFSNLAIDAAGTYTLQATSGTLTPASSSSITINASTPAKLVWTTQPPSVVTQGIAFGAALAVQDRYGNLESTYSQNVTTGLDLGGNPDTTDLGGTVTVAASGGAVSFSSLIINNSGSTFTLVATSNGITSPQSNPINVVLPHLAITSQPTSAVTAGTAFTIAVNVQTNLNALDSGFSGSVNLSIDTGPAGASITGTTSATVSGGTATMANVTLDTAGTYTLKVSGTNLTSVDTVSISVAPQDTVAALVIQQQPPGTVQAGTGFGLIVGGEDQFGNATPLTGQVALALSNNPGSASLGGTTTVNPSKGVATFSGLTIDTVGTGYTIVATMPSIASVTTSGITVTNAAATKLVIPSNGEPPSSLPAGQAFALVVNAEDPYGNIDPSFTGTVALTQPTNIIGTTSLKAQGGVATFSDLVINTAGTYQIQATASPLSPATSSSLTVTGSAQGTLLVWAAEPPGSVVHNAAFGVTVDVKDQFGNLETGYSGTVTVKLDTNPGSATLHGTTTVNVSGGVATFLGLSINVLGNGYTLLATSQGLSTPDSSPINVTPIPAVSVKVSTQPPTSVQDTQPFGLSVTALDQSGNLDPDFQGNMTVSIQSPADSNALGGTPTVAASGGTALFSNLTLNALGTYVLAISSNGLTPATTGAIVVTANSATQLVALTEPPTSFTAGAPFTLQIKAEDQYGNLATDFSGTLTATLSTNPAGAMLLGSSTATANSGIASFTGVSVGAVGSGYTIQVTATGLTGVTTTAFSVKVAAASQIELSNPPPAEVTAGVPFGMSFTVEDPYGNPEPSFSGPVTIALANNPGTVILNGALMGTAIGGQVGFSGLTLDTVGAGYTIDATSPGLSAVTTGSIDVVPASAAKLVVSIQPPGSLFAGASFGLAISAEDAFGNIATGSTANVILSLQGPSGPVPLNGGPLTLQATAGVANFGARLAIDTAGSGYTILATSGGLSPTNTRAISVTGLTPTKLAIEDQPPALLAPGATFGFVVGAVDPYGNVNAKFNGPITIALAPGSGATLGGVMSATAVNGLATFQGLTLSGLSNPAIIQASTSTLAGTQTNPITPTIPAVTSAPPPPVAMTSVQVVKLKLKKHKPAVPVIVIGFSGGLNAGEASSFGEYQLIVAGKKNSFTAKNAKSLPLASVVYNAANHTVTLTPKKKLVLRKPIELVVNTNPPAGIQDSNGQFVDGNRDGQPGGNGVAVLKGKSVTLTVAMVDVLLERGSLGRTRGKAR